MNTQTEEKLNNMAREKPAVYDYNFAGYNIWTEIATECGVSGETLLYFFNHYYIIIIYY